MASRYDQIPQFNPFIQDAPLELVSQVGLYKQDQYNQGVQKIQSYIDKVAGVDLLKDTDKQYLQQKLSKIGEDVSKLASQDFSNPNLQNHVGNIAMAAFKDDKIQNGYLGTQKVRAKQAQIKELNEKHPELYNPDNEAYAMLDVVSWLNDGQAGTKLVDNRSYYNYHDYSKEVREAMKDFKPTKIRTKSAEGEWSVLREDQSYTEGELKEYLNAVLSDKSKQQMKIESVIRFHGQDDVLMGSYYKTLKGNIMNNDKDIRALQARVTVLKGDPDQQALLQQRISALQEANLEYIDQADNIDKGNLNFFNSKKENIAEWMFKEAYVDKVAKGFSHDDKTVEYSANEIWKTKFQESMQNARANARMEFDAGQNALNRADNEKDRANARMLKLMDMGMVDAKGNALGTSSSMFKASYSADESDKTVRGRDEFDKEYTIIQQEGVDNLANMREILLSRNPQLRALNLAFVKKNGKSNTPEDPVTVAMNQYLNDQYKLPKDQRNSDVNNFIEQQNELMTRQRILDDKRDAVEYKVKLNYPDLDMNKVIKENFPEKEATVSVNMNIKGIGPGSSSNLKITPELLINSLDPSNKNGLKIVRAKKVAGGQDEFELYDKGQKVGTVSSSPSTIPGAFSKALGTFRDPEVAKLERMFDNAKMVTNTKSKVGQAIQFRNNLYSEEVVNMGDWWTPVSTKDPRMINALNYVQRNYGGDAEDWTVSMVNQSTGEVKVRVNPKARKGATGDNAKTAGINTDLLEASGAVYDAENDAYTLPSGQIPGFTRQGLENLSPTERTLVKALDVNQNIPQVGYHTPNSTYDPNGNGQFVQLVKEKEGDGFKYYIYHEDSDVRIDQQNLYDPISAINAAKTLTADKKMLQDIIRLKKPNYNVK